MINNANNELAVRQLKLTSGEEIICYVGNLEKGTINIDYPLQILPNIQTETYTFKPWWNVFSPLVSCMLNVSHIMSTYIPGQEDLDLYLQVIQSIKEEYSEERVPKSAGPDEVIH